MEQLAKYVIDEYVKPWNDSRQILFESNWCRKVAAYRKEDFDTDVKSINDMYASESSEEEGSKTYIGITRTKTITAAALVTDNLLQQEKFPFKVDLDPMVESSLREADPESQTIAVDELVKINSQLEAELNATGSHSQLGTLALTTALYGDGYGKLISDDDGNLGLQATSVWDILRDWSASSINTGLGVIQRHMLSDYDASVFALGLDIDDLDIVRRAIKAKKDSQITENPQLEEINHTSSSNLNELLECYVKVPTHLIIPDEEEDVLAWTEITLYILNGVGISFVPDTAHPFYHVPFQEDIDSVSNIGVPDNTEDLQHAMNVAFRIFEDNKKLASKVWGFYNPDCMDPENQTGIKIGSGMFYPLSDTCEDASKAVQQVQVADVGQSALSLIQVIDTMSDEHSMIPKILAGATGGGDRTAYETSQQIDKAGKYIASVIRNFDKYLIEPMSNDMLSMRYNDTNGIKCIALGYRSYTDRTSRIRQINEFLNLIMVAPDLAREYNLSRLAKHIGLIYGFDSLEMLKTATERESDNAQAEESAELDNEIQRKNIEKLTYEVEKLRGEAIHSDELNDAKVGEIEAKTDKLNGEIQ